MSRALALALAMVILALLLATPHGGTQAQDQVEVKIRWVTYINPTEGQDIAFGTCAFGDYIAVVGRADFNPYVALLHKSNGSIVKKWIGNMWGGLLNCISIDGKLYAVGSTFPDKGLIYVFDENLNILEEITGIYPSSYSSLAYDGKALYVGGLAYEDLDGDGVREQVGLVEKIEKRDPDTLILTSRKIYFDSWKNGWIADIDVEPSTGRVWAVGSYYDSSGKGHSLIIVFDSNLRKLKVIDYPEGSEGYLGDLYGIAFDGWQHVYILGRYRVAKFSVDGELIAINRDYDYLRAWAKIVYGYNHLYIFGTETDIIKGYDRHMLYILDTNLNIVKKYVLSESVDAPSSFLGGRPALEGSSIYVAGYDYALGFPNLRIVVYSLSIEGIMVTATVTTVTVTTTVITTITRNMTLTTTITIPTTTTATVTLTVPTTTTVTTTTTATETTTVTATATVPTTTTVIATVPVTKNITVTTVSMATVTKIDTVTMSVPTTVTITTTTPVTATATVYVTVPTIITVPDRIPTQSIIGGLVAIGVVLAIAVLLLTALLLRRG